jgi:hypothetical protein
MTHDTYDRRIHVGASRRRREDARSCRDAKRFAAAIYIGGYAIECALVALVCYEQRKTNFKDTSAYKERGLRGAKLHTLSNLLAELPTVRRAIQMDRTHQLRTAWERIQRLWDKDRLRYWDKVGDEDDCDRFVAAIETFHDYLLRSQGEA